MRYRNCVYLCDLECLSAYKARNGRFPSRIIFYRSTDWIPGDDTFYTVGHGHGSDLKWDYDKMGYRNYELEKVKVICRWSK